MAETRQTILERVALYIMELRGAEEVEERIEKVDASFRAFAKDIQQSKSEMEALSLAFRNMGISISAGTLKILPQATAFLEKYGEAMKPLQGTTEELSAAQWVLTDAGRAAAMSTGLMTEAVVESKKETEGLKDAFWKLNSAARALLRIFVAFKILTGVIGIFRDMGVATVDLQREMWSLRVIILSAGQEIEGGLGSWDSWLERIQRMRRELPLINMTDLVRGMKTLIVTLDDLGLAADEMEYIIQLAGEMAVLMGLDFPAYAQRVSTALQGQVRNWAALGINVKDSSAALREYSQELGYNWDELNKQQKILLRTLFLTKEMIRMTEEMSGEIDEQWKALEALRAKRADLMAQQPKLIQFQVVWNQLLILGTEAAAIAAEAITRFFATIVSGIGALTVVVLETIQAMGEGRSAWDALSGGVERFGEIQDEIYQGIVEGTTVLDYLGEKLDGAGEEAEKAADPFSELVDAMKLMIDAAADAGDAAEDLADRMRRALQQAGDALRSYQRAVESAGIRLGRRLTDIVRNLEEKLADLESRFELRRAQLLARFEERRADLREEGAEKEEELRADLNKRLQRMEEDHLLDMQELREDYLIDLQEAARKRDAVSMRRIQQRYILEKKQRERDFGVRRRRAIEDYKEQITELKKAREEQERELEKSLERQLRELQENYERQQEEARLNAERQREDALRNYQEQLSDLWRNFQDRLETIAINLMEEEKEYKDAFGDLRAFFDKWYTDDLTALREWLAKRAFMIQMEELRESLPPWMQPFVPPVDFGMAQGGMGIARQPTRIMVGEAGPEMFAAWPLGQRTPRLGADIRLTIDGTQSGAWSADFENQTLRILREVLEEAL